MGRDSLKDEFLRFCISRSCAKAYRGQENYCPLADRIRAKNDGILTGYNCRKEWESWQKGKEDKT